MKKKSETFKKETVETKTRKGICKFDSRTARFLPVSAGRQRKKGFAVERKVNDIVLSIKAPESLNGYDLISLFQMVDDYQKRPDLWTKRGDFKGADGVKRKLVFREFDLSEVCKERDISSNKHNRASVLKSFDRWFKAEIEYHYNNKTLFTKYIYEFLIDSEFKKIKIVANASFLDFCTTSGMAMNWQRLLKYGKNAYAVELDLFMQFNSHKKGKKYYYPSVVRENTLFERIGVEGEIKEEKHKREKLKEAFKAFEKETGQKYILKKDNDGYFYVNSNYEKYIADKDKRA